MKKLFLYILFALIIINASAQDSKSLPLEFAYNNSELDSFIKDNFIVPMEAAIDGFKTSIPIKFTVDSLGNITDFKFDGAIVMETHQWEEKHPGSSEVIRNDYKKEAERVIMLTKGLWAIAEENGHTINASFSKKIVLDSKHTAGYINIVNDSAGYFYDLGTRRMSQKRFLIANKYFETAISYDSVFVDAYYNLGVCNLRLNKIKTACKAWQKAESLGDLESKGLIEKYCKQ